MIIAVYARSTKDNHAEYVEVIYNYLKSEGVDVIIHEAYYEYLKTTFNFNLQLDTFSTAEELISKAFYLVCLGGDGTMLETVTLVRKSGIPILGVNTGRLGFLATVNKNDLQKALQM